MIDLLLNGHVALFAVILFAIIFSLTFHECGHAASAKLLGDDTAERAGRLTLNPIAHIDPLGLLLVVMVGFGYAKPVPVSPRRLRFRWGPAAVAFAGPFMNLVLAVIAVNIVVWGVKNGVGFLREPGSTTMLLYLARINVLLMLFNLIPLGPLDGHYILEWLLPRHLSMRFAQFNAQYGSGVFLLLILLSVFGVPIFRTLFSLVDLVLPLITFV